MFPTKLLLIPAAHQQDGRSKCSFAAVILVDITASRREVWGSLLKWMTDRFWIKQFLLCCATRNMTSPPVTCPRLPAPLSSSDSFSFNLLFERCSHFFEFYLTFFLHLFNNLTINIFAVVQPSLRQQRRTGACPNQSRIKSGSKSDLGEKKRNIASTILWTGRAQCLWARWCYGSLHRSEGGCLMQRHAASLPVWDCCSGMSLPAWHDQTPNTIFQLFPHTKEWLFKFWQLSSKSGLSPKVLLMNSEKTLPPTHSPECDNSVLTVWFHSETEKAHHKEQGILRGALAIYQ